MSIFHTFQFFWNLFHICIKAVIPNVCMCVCVCVCVCVGARGVTDDAMDYGIVVSEFILQSCYYVHFWANTLGGERYKTPYPLSYGLNNTTTVLLAEWFWH